MKASTALAVAIVLSSAGAAHADAESPLFVRDLNDGPRSLRGFVDLHTHPMAHLGMGGKMLHGAPDVDVLMLPGSLHRSRGRCNKRPKRARNVAEALGSCFGAHGRHSLIKNRCGNHLRRIVLKTVEETNNTTGATHDVDHPPGAPSFARWPKHNDILHQQMWISWVKRAHAGGLRVMVALANNSVTLSTGLDGNKPFDDKSAGNLQIAEMRRMVGRHPWMEIATSAAELRRIVGQDKLAILLGLELDDLGNFAQRRRPPTAAAVRAEIRRLHAQKVRYLFPMHVIDNHFGGSAIYQDEFPRATRYHFGRWPALTCAQPGDNITKRVSDEIKFAYLLRLGAAGGKIPIPPCPGAVGMKNIRGLTPLGKVALDEMMKLGIIIDLDHASQQTANDILEYAATKPGRYPIVSGHNALRGSIQKNGSTSPTDEKTRTASQYRAIARLGGVVGIDFDSNTAGGFLADVRRVLGASPSLSINLGSDINGYVLMPRPPAACARALRLRTRLPDKCVRYTRAFPAAQMGGVRWDYNRDGVAHIGLFPDFLRHIENIGGDAIVDRLFDGAEGVAGMWERAEAVGRRMDTPRATRESTVRSVSVIIRTGRDDVRRGSRALIRVRFRGGGESAWLDVSQLSNRRNRTKRVRVPLGRAVRPSDIVALQVRHISGDCFGCRTDHWNASMTVVAAGARQISTPPFRMGHQIKTFNRR